MKALGKTGFRAGAGRRALGYLALSGLLAAWAAGGIREACRGELVPPLDDTYIYLQYARAAAAGTPLSYQEGAPPTRGATSLLYPLLLAPWARLAPGALLWAAFLGGFAGLAVAALAADRWAERRVGAGAGWMAGFLTFASGHLVWGAASGMDIALLAAALTVAAALVPWYEDAPDPRAGVRRLAALWLALAALSLARPDGALPALAVALAVPLGRAAPNSRRARWILILAPFLVVGGTALVETLARGAPGSNTLEAKAVWSEQRPDLREATFRQRPEVLGTITRALFTDFAGRSFGHGTAAVLALLLAGGAAWGVVRAWRSPRGLAPRTVLAMLAAGLLAGLVPLDFNVHHHRYQIPYVPLAHLLALYGLARAVPARSVARRLVLPGLLLVLLLPGVPRYVDLAARNAADIHGHQVAMGRWIDAHLPPDAVVGINDAGAIAYYGNRRVVDLVGLVTNGAALPHAAGYGPLYEWLESLPPAERPTHFAVFPRWFPYLRHTSLFGERLVQFTLRERTISGADVKALHVADWGHTGRGEELWQRWALLDVWGFRVLDALDVAHLESERAHDYEAFPTWRSTLREFPVAGRSEVALIDGGRQPARGERFRMRCRPRAPGALVLRTEAYRSFTLRVEVDGRFAGTWDVPARPGEWMEPVFSLVDTVLTAETAAFTLTLLDSLPGYPSFHYWLLQ
jgi:hypothetical protein